jgi:uncharacterized integral membrane protein
MEHTSPTAQAPQKGGITKKQVRLIGLLVALALAVILVAQNTAEVKLTLWFFPVTISLIVLMLICMVLGAILTWILISVRASRKKNEATKLRNEVKKLQDELKKTNQRITSKG